MQFNLTSKMPLFFFNVKLQEPQAEMFLRVEGYQVEYKEVNKSWERPNILQIKLGRYYCWFILFGFLRFSIWDKSSLYLATRLSSQTLYHVRARARNKAGLSDPSNIIYFKTNGLSAQALNHTSSAKRTKEAGILVSLLVVRELTRWLQ